MFRIPNPPEYDWNLLKDENRMKIVIPIGKLDRKILDLMANYKKDINFRWIKIKEILEKIKK